MHERPLVKTFLMTFINMDMTRYINMVAKKLKQNSKNDKKEKEPELICRICEETMCLDKYIV